MRLLPLLRWVHFLAGLNLSFYIVFQPDAGWGDPYGSFVKFAAVPFVFWTGVIRWQLPRYRSWRARRRGLAGTA